MLQQAHLFGTRADPAQARIDLWNSIKARVDRTVSQSADQEIETAAQDILADLDILLNVEMLWTFPGTLAVLALREAAERRDLEVVRREVVRIAQLLSTFGDEAAVWEGTLTHPGATATERPHYFTVMAVNLAEGEELVTVKQGIAEARQKNDPFVYEVVHLNNFEDALMCVLFNTDVQVVVLREDFMLRNNRPHRWKLPGIEAIIKDAELSDLPRSVLLAQAIRRVRPHLEIYLLTNSSLPSENVDTYRIFNRVFYRYESLYELHMTVMAGVAERYETPYFNVLQSYASRPIGNFHALPIARGHSVFNSRWIRDMGEFYGRNIFKAESSATTGGLDSLLEPTGNIKRAQDKAARAFGAKHTFFATNGTSTSNKIVVQALTKPQDIVVIDRNCHKSHHYGLVLTGGHPVYVDAYPLEPYAIYGGVPLREIKKKLLELRRAGRLDAVRMILLTNCTFDGITYNPLHVMQELLAIKPDLCFLWDEAWFAYATFSALARNRTAMYAAETLTHRLRSPLYKESYRAWKERFSRLDQRDDSTWLDHELMPDPEQARVRVYATQSTHKSLSAFRQGSMIHIHDEDFESQVADAFNESYLTHTSTSPNLQILASLDLARRQVELEGYRMVQEAMQHALRFREVVASDSLISRFFSVLDQRDLVPSEYRPSGFSSFVEMQDYGTALAQFNDAYQHDEFVLDPTRMSLFVGETGISGDAFKTRVLMDQFGIQVNKSSINSVLFNSTIGATWGTLSHLLDVLRREAHILEQRLRGASTAEQKLHVREVARLTRNLPHLPDFSMFHDAFRPYPASPEGDMRTAFFLGNDERNRDYVKLRDAFALLDSGQELVSTSFVVPYPPGFPVLVPGQVITRDLLTFLDELDVKEVHGYRAELGLAVFTDEALEHAPSMRLPERARPRPYFEPPRTSLA